MSEACCLFSRFPREKFMKIAKKHRKKGKKLLDMVSRFVLFLSFFGKLAQSIKYQHINKQTKNMGKKSSVSGPITDLQLVTCDHLRGYARQGAHSFIRIWPAPSPFKALAARATPGSVQCSHNLESGIWAKKIRYSRRSEGADTEIELAELSCCNLIALYTDERGFRRSCGSPAHPLRLEYEESGGVYEIEISGKETCADLYAEISESFF